MIKQFTLNEILIWITVKILVSKYIESNTKDRMGNQ